MGQHTAGPWRIDWNISRLDIFAAGGQLIARLLRSTKDGAPTYDDAEAIANARLIAAAPELLKALADLVARCEYDGIPNDSLPAVEAARDAIAKAQGSQQ